MREFFRGLAHALEAGQPAVLVSILTASGSTPRGAGAMMAVFSDGSIAGTIGGGNVEFAARRTAEELLASHGGNLLRSFRFVQGDAASLGMVCGGDVTVHFQVLHAGDVQASAVFRSLMNASAEGTGAWLARRLNGAAVLEQRAATEADRDDETLRPLLADHPLLTEDGWFSIPVEKPGFVYVFGGGHVSQELVPVLARVGFRAVVWDDRTEFADPALFPQAARTICADFESLRDRLTFRPDDYVVVVTRGHQADYEVLTQVLRSGVRYIGCIGSRRKLSLSRDRLLKAGFTAEEFAAVHAPIGLSIGAETPEEIAVSIAAEMIAVRAGVKAPGRWPAESGESCKIQKNCVQ